MNNKKATKKTTPANKKTMAKHAPANKPGKSSVPKKQPTKKKSNDPKTTKKNINLSKKSKSQNKQSPSDLDSLIELENLNLEEGYKPNEGEEYMNEMQLAYFKIKLLDWKNELIHQSQETLYNLKTESRDVSDEAERASRESDNILELRTRDRYRKLLAKIDAGLRRIGDGSYGYCEETGEEIGLRRLEARPTATLTVDAQERREMLQKQFRDDR